MAEEKENALVRFYHWAMEAANAWTLLVASGVGGFVAWVLPFDWKTATPWMWTLTTFAGTWVFARLVISGYRKMRRWRNPATLVVVPNGGTKASLTLKHVGEPTTYFADGRIVETLDGSANPAGALFECELFHKGTQAGAKHKLANDEWASIIVANILHDQSGRTHLAIRRGSINHQTPVADNGVIVEYTIRAAPPLPTGTKVKRFHVVRHGGSSIRLTHVADD
jgi:hypothetical protein